MNLDQNHFELFGLPARFRIDPDLLDRRYRELQREVHPDRFAAASQAEQRMSIQFATRVNEAYQALKSPAGRATYLLELQGIDPQFETNTAMPAEFLAGQMELREALEEADGPDALARLSARLHGDRDALVEKLGQELDERGAWNAATATLRQLMFLDRLREEIAEAEERMEG